MGHRSVPHQSLCRGLGKGPESSEEWPPLVLRNGCGNACSIIHLGLLCPKDSHPPTLSVLSEF